MIPPQDPRRQPLQDDEVALARILRALPAGEPPARLDDAILRAATDAVAPGPRKPVRALPWLPTWAIGTAAAAVLAVGIGTQLRPPLAPDPQAGAVAEETRALPQARERLSVDLVEPKQPAAPPPAAAPPEPRRATRTAPPPPPPAPAPVAPPPVVLAPEAFPAAEAEAPAVDAAAPAASNDAGAALDRIEVQGTRLRSESTDQARRVHQELTMRRAQAKASAEAERREEASADAERRQEAAAEAMAPAVASPSPVSATPAAAPPAVGGLADARSQAAALPPVAEDRKLAPDEWIARIRERATRGDVDGARASLAQFTQAHPRMALPSDLEPLR